MDGNTLEKMEKLFRSAFYLAMKERPYSDFPDVLELQALNGVKVGETYRNDRAAKNFISHIGGIYHDTLKELLHNADYFSANCDGSTDRTVSEKEIVMVRVLEDFYPKVKYLKIVEPPNTKADGILQAINGAFQDFGFTSAAYKKKLVGFGSDGASVMMGARQGVIKLLKDESDAPLVLAVWCLAHRLELAVKDCFKGTYMDKVTDVLSLIYKFYKGSSKRNKEVQDIAEVMDEHFSKPNKANGTRWVEHKLKAAKKIVQNWNLIIIHMENYAEDESNKAEDRAKARGILKKIREYKLVWFLHFLVDVLNEITRISLLFQREDITLPSAMIKVKSAKQSLHTMITNSVANLQKFQGSVNGATYKGQTLTHVVDGQVLSTEKRKIIQNLIVCLDNRFANWYDEPVYSSCNIFDHRNWPDEGQAEDQEPEDNDDEDQQDEDEVQQPTLADHGSQELRIITDHFQTVLQNCGCDIPAAFTEWSDLKVYVKSNSHLTRKHPLLVWQRISQEDSEIKNYSNIVKVIHLTAIYPLANASCERGFSTMKRVKSNWWCSLSCDSLDTLMRIKIDGPRKLADFQPGPAIKQWWNSSDRQRRPDFSKDSQLV